MDRDYINAVGIMIQRKMEPIVKAAFKRTEERVKTSPIRVLTAE